MCPTFGVHYTNGWFAQRLKAYNTGQRLKALAFLYRSSPSAFDSRYALKGLFVLLTRTPKGVFVFFDAQLVQGYVVFLLLFDVLADGSLIEPYRAHVVPF